MPIVNRIEPGQGGEQAPVGFRQFVTCEIALARELCLDSIKSGEQRVEGGLIGCLGGSEAALVNSIVHVVIDIGVNLVDPGTQVSGKKIDLPTSPLIEGGVQHPDNLGGFVVDDRVAVFIPQYRNRHAARVFGAGQSIDLV